MDMSFKSQFLKKWEHYYPGADLPIIFFYTNEEDKGALVVPPSNHQCIIGVLGKVRNGTSLCFGVDSFGCGGAKRYLGYTKEMRPGFEYFISCGIEGEMEGERYKKSPEIVRELMKAMPDYEAPKKYIVFKRWDRLEGSDDPEVVVFFANPDVVSGLFTLSGFDQVTSESTIAPFSAGCGSIVMYPYLEKDKENPRAVLGMFDVSARPYVPRETLSFSVPMKRFQTMVGYMDESFLTTKSWDKVRKRMKH